MPHIEERQGGMIVKIPPEPGLVQVQENTVLVLRSAWSSNPFSRGLTDEEKRRRAQIMNIRPETPISERTFEGYVVKREGWRLYIPSLIHDFVAFVSLAPRQEDVLPMAVNVANGQGVDFNIRFSVVVGEMNWNNYKVPISAAGVRIRESGRLLEERYPHLKVKVTQAIQKGRDFIILRDPVNPFDKDEPFVTTEAAIIRAALRPENIWHEAFTTIQAALNEAALELGVGTVEPLKVVNWLNTPHTVGQPGTNRDELMEKVVVTANHSLHRFGIVIFDPRLEGITLPAALEKAVEQLQSAEQADKAADHRSSAIEKQMKAGRMNKPPEHDPLGVGYVAQAWAFGRALESLDAQSGVPSSRAPIVSVGDVMSGNAVGGPGGGSSKGGSDKKSGGGGAPKKKP